MKITATAAATKLVRKHSGGALISLILQGDERFLETVQSVSSYRALDADRAAKEFRLLFIILGK